jgi:hypothetical protein
MYEIYIGKDKALLNEHLGRQIHINVSLDFRAI